MLVKLDLVKFDTQAELFDHMWKTEPHLSMISGEKLGPEPLASNFMHISPKGSLPFFKTLSIDVWLVTPFEHELYDRFTDLARKIKEFEFVFIYRQYLTWLYHRLMRMEMPKKDDSKLYRKLFYLKYEI